MAWIDASTDEYWSAHGLPDWSSEFVYLGDGVWEGMHWGRVLPEYEATPFRGDPYNSTTDSTISGLRFTLSFTSNFYGSGTDISASIVTNRGKQLVGETISFPDMVLVTHSFIFEYSAELGERPVAIYIYGSFGSYYGENPRIYDIQVRLDDQNNTVWTSHVGTIEVL